MSKDPKSTYYDEGGIEVLDVIKAKLTPEQYKGYLLGNSIKYNLRANFKGDMYRDMEKSEVYARALKETIGEEAKAISIAALEGDSGEEEPCDLERKLDSIFPDLTPSGTPTVVQTLAAKGARKIYARLMDKIPTMRAGEHITVSYELEIDT